MDRIMDVAAYITTRYQKISNKEIDEMMLYKLLYLVQRDSLAIMGVPAFQEELVVQKNGPISRDVRANYCEGEIICPTEEPSDSVTYIADNVLSQYGQLSNQNFPWTDLCADFCSDNASPIPLKLEGIRKDAEKVRPYDHQWDMYYDEFENVGTP